MKTIKPLVILCGLVILSSCAVITGREDESGAPAPLDIRFIESLRNQDSLSGGGWSEPQVSTAPAASLQQPRSVCADTHRVYVIDSYTSAAIISPRIFVFDRTARTAAPVPLPVFPSEGALVDPLSIARDSMGVIWVADAQRGAVYGYDLGGTLLSVIGRAGEVGRPTALAADAARGRVYIADAASRQIRILSSPGARLSVLQGPDAAPLEFRSVRGLAVDQKGDLYVLDARERAVQVYSSSGEKRRVLGIPGEPPLLAPNPSGIAVDSDGHVYIADSGNNAVLILDPAGALLQIWGRTGSLAGDFWAPSAIFIDDHDLIYIADRMNGRVQVFQYVK